MKVGKSPPLPGLEYRLAFGVRELPLLGRRRCFRAYAAQSDRVLRTPLLVSSSAGRGCLTGDDEHMGGLRQDPDLAKERSTTRVSPVCGNGASVCCSCRPHASTCGETGRAGEARGRHGRLAVCRSRTPPASPSSLGLTSSRPVVRRPRRGCVWPGWIARSRRCTGRRTLGRLWTAAPGVRVPGWSCVPRPSRASPLIGWSCLPGGVCARCRSGGQRMVLGGKYPASRALCAGQTACENPLWCCHVEAPNVVMVGNLRPCRGGLVVGSRRPRGADSGAPLLWVAVFPRHPRVCHVLLRALRRAMTNIRRASTTL